MKRTLPRQILSTSISVKQVGTGFAQRKFASNMASSNQFPPEKVRVIVSEVVSLLQERKESVSVAETVSLSFPCCLLVFFSRNRLLYLHSSARKLGMFSPLLKSVYPLH
jgi:hypothetical protein